MDRFQELQQKVKSTMGGYMKLSKEEQAEYTLLRKQSGNVEFSDLSGKELAYSSTLPATEVPVKPEYCPVRLKEHPEKPGVYAVDWKFKKRVYDNEKREEDISGTVSWLGTDNNITEEPFLLRAFLKAPRVKVPVLDRKKFIEKVSHGKTTKGAFSNDKIKQGQEMIIETHKFVYRVKLPDDREIEIDDRHVNS